MKQVYLFIFIYSFCACVEGKEISSVIIKDTSVLQQIMQMQHNDSLSVDSIYKNNEWVKANLSPDNFNAVFLVLHTNPDTTYQNNQNAYTVTQLITDKYFLVNNQLVKMYANFSSNGSDKYLEENMKKYFSRMIFQWFYTKGTQSELLKSEIQELMQPKTISNMLDQDPNIEKIKEQFVFLAKNSSIKLFKL